MWLISIGLCLAADKLSDKSKYPNRFVGKYGYKMRLVKGGKGIMGGLVEKNVSELEDEHRREVTLSRPFYMGETEITLKLWRLIMDENPTKMSGKECFRSDYPLIVTDAFPVFCVDFNSVLEFANLLSEWEGYEACYDLSGYQPSWTSLDCNGYRLPTEAEWEVAARGIVDPNHEKTTPYVYAGADSLDEVGWFVGNSGMHPNPVAQKKSNPLGFYDMSGNVWEWVWDWYGEYNVSKEIDPIGPQFGYQRVIRGGSWANEAMDLRVANRFSRPPSHRSAQIGLRLVRRPK